MTLYDLSAPAKLNLFLHVVGRRADGYHLLQSVFRLVSLSDSITIDIRRDGLISIETNYGSDVDPSQDLAAKAARLLQEKTGCGLGAHLHVTKRIPMGGGLGGGSSDAATVLMALNRLWRLGLNRSALSQLGFGLGADVPFFINGCNAFVEGVGELLSAVSLQDASYLIFKPPVAVPTPAIFGCSDLTRNSETVKISDFSGRARFIGSKTGLKTTEFQGFGKNDLEPVARKLYPEVDKAMHWAVEQGFDVRLSGSGGCFFSEYESPERASLARARLVGKIQLDRVNGVAPVAAIDEISACDGWPEHPLRHWIDD